MRIRSDAVSWVRLHRIFPVLSSDVPQRILGVIPARYSSSRFPGKALVTIAGKTMLEHVWERASQSRYLTSLVIATDDDRIRAAAESFKARVVMTRSDHVSGTDRVAEAASASNADWIVNVQGDEPTLDPNAIDTAILGVLGQENALMGTLKTPLRAELAADPNIVKVVTDAQGNAIYFSRAPIPFHRDHASAQNRDRQEAAQAAYYKHIGLYIYRREFLLAYPDLPVGPLEQAERLEQLRALENGFKIHVVETDYDALGVDTPEDYQHVVALFEKTMVRQ